MFDHPLRLKSLGKDRINSIPSRSCPEGGSQGVGGLVYLLPKRRVEAHGRAIVLPFFLSIGIVDFCQSCDHSVDSLGDLGWHGLRTMVENNAQTFQGDIDQEVGVLCGPLGGIQGELRQTGNAVRVNPHLSVPKDCSGTGRADHLGIPMHIAGLDLGLRRAPVFEPPLYLFV